MRVFRPQQVVFYPEFFQFRLKHHLSVTLMLGFPLGGGEPLLEPDLWKLICSSFGKDASFDLGMPKPNGEVLLSGSYFSPGGTPVKQGAARLKIGKIDKTLLVYGDRYWRTLLGPTDPMPFRTMPLDYAHAFGGQGFRRNPLGKGTVDVDCFGEMRRPLPNIEHPDRVMSSSGQRPDPAGFGPLDAAWEFRVTKAGTYDEKWLAERWPAFADDIDWNYFNSAPPDQWIDGFFAGNESFELYNLHPNKPLIQGHLPSFRIRCFIDRPYFEDKTLEEVELRAETVWLIPEAETGIVLYRGAIGIASQDGEEIENIIVGYENLSDAPRNIDHYEQALSNRLDPDLADKYDFFTTDLMPHGVRCGDGALEVPEDFPPLEEPTEVEEDDDTSEHKAAFRESLLTLSARLAFVPGAAAVRVKVEEIIHNLDLPSYFPRPPGYERIHELRAHAYYATYNNKQRNTDKVEQLPAPLELDFDIDSLMEQLEDSDQELKEGYRAQAHLIEEGRPLHEKTIEHVRSEFFGRLEKKQKIAGLDLAGLDLSNLDFSGVDFSGCYLEGVNFSGSKLVGADFHNAILVLSDLSGSDFTQANLTRANLGNADLSNAIFDNADMTEAILSFSYCSDTRFVNCNLTDADMHETFLTNADFSESNLTGAEFIELDMNEAIFRNAHLANSTFIKCHLHGANFSGAILDKATWIDSWLYGADFSEAHMIDTRFPGKNIMRDSRFVKAILESSNLLDADLRNADFTEANLTMCNFSKAEASKARFTRAIARNAQFIGTNLGEADLSSIDLMEGALMKARLTSAKIRGANCYGVDLDNAIVGETDFAGTNLVRTLLEKWRPH